MKLREAASVLRSKNAGPLTLTVDILFADSAIFAQAAASPRLTESAIAARYGVAADSVSLIRVAPALAIKINLPRPIVAGSPGDHDVYGAQQHVPLLDIEL